MKDKIEQIDKLLTDLEDTYSLHQSKELAQELHELFNDIISNIDIPQNHTHNELGVKNIEPLKTAESNCIMVIPSGCMQGIGGKSLMLKNADVISVEVENSHYNVKPIVDISVSCSSFDYTDI